jgi:uncharacterized protein YaaR (DUF327 family)
MLTVICEASVHKKGENPGDCQDACAVNRKAGRFAIADGVSRSFLSAEWAKLLVEYLCKDESDLNRLIFSNENWEEWLRPIQKKWNLAVVSKEENWIGPFSHRIKRYIDNKEPASATFIGLEVTVDDPHSGKANCRAMVIGDSCLFIIRNDKIEISFPFESSGQFVRATSCFVSFPDKQKHQPCFKYYELEANDVIILATDGLAKWLLQQQELGKENWQTTWEKVQQIKNWDTLYEFTRHAQNSYSNPMDNDDVTLLTVAIADPSYNNGNVPKAIGFYNSNELQRQDNPEKSPAHEEVSSYLFKLSDAKKLLRLSEKIKNPTDALSQHLCDKLLPNTKEVLKMHVKDSEKSQELKEALVKDFNTILEDSSLYRTERFINVKLRDETGKLLVQSPNDQESIHLNRLLLEDAFPNELRERRGIRQFIKSLLPRVPISHHKKSRR